MSLCSTNPSVYFIAISVIACALAHASPRALPDLLHEQ